MSAEVTLRFKTEAARDYFMGQLADGWGENVCYLDWDEDLDFRDVHWFDVTPFDLDGEEIVMNRDRQQVMCVLDEILEDSHQDLRVGQILCNAFGIVSPTLFYMDDRRLISLLYERLEENTRE